MIMTVEALIATIVSCVSFCGTVTAIYFAIKNYRRTDRGDLARHVEESTRLNAKLDMVCQSTLKIEQSIQKISDKVEEHGKHIVILEQSVNALHKRVDKLETREERLKSNE